MAKIKAIACEVMRDEWAAVNKYDVETLFLEQGLHRYPEKLHSELQAAIDTTGDCDGLLLGYGLCANALVGLRAGHCPLILPLVEDCIGLFLGSAATYLAEFHREPATYYFTKGWVVAGKDPYQEYFRSCEKWGEEEALWIAREIMKNYRRAAYIDTGCYDSGEYYAYTGRFADFFGLRREKLAGSLAFFSELLAGDRRRCLIVGPGESVSEDKFRQAMRQHAEVRPTY